MADPLEPGGTTTDCSLIGVHEHAFRGPHRFHEWDPTAGVRGPEDGLREALAAIEHDQWIAWSKDLAAKEALSADRIRRWVGMWVPYADLDEPTKDFDRVWADKVLAALRSTPAAPKEDDRDV